MRLKINALTTARIRSVLLSKIHEIVDYIHRSSFDRHQQAGLTCLQQHLRIFVNNLNGKNIYNFR